MKIWCFFEQQPGEIQAPVFHLNSRKFSSPRWYWDSWHSLQMAGTCPCGIWRFFCGSGQSCFVLLRYPWFYFTYCKVYTQIIDIHKYPTFSNKDGKMVRVDRYRKEEHQRNFLGEETPGGQSTGLGKMSKSMSSLSSIAPGFPCSSGKTMGPGWPRSHTGSSWIWKWQPSFSGHRLRIFHGLSWPCLQVLCLIPLAYMTYTAYFSCLAFRGARGPWWSAGCHDGRCFPTQLCYWSKFEIHSNQGFGHFEAFWWHVWSMNFFSIRVFRHHLHIDGFRYSFFSSLEPKSKEWWSPKTFIFLKGVVQPPTETGGQGRCPTGWGIFRLKISGWYGPGCQSLLAFEVDMGRKNIQ